MMANSNRQTRKKQLTKELLKSTFIDLILENNSVESITINEITDRADFNRGTFYHHYQDKIDLLEDLYQDAIQGVVQSIKTPYRDMNQVLFNESIPLKLIFQHIDRSKKLFKALSLIDQNPDIYDRLETSLWNLFTDEIQIERANITSKTEYEILISIDIHATLGVLKYWITKDFEHPVDFMSEQVASFYRDKVIGMNLKKNIS